MMHLLSNAGSSCILDGSNGRAHRHIRSFLGEGDCDPAADATTTTGDDRHLLGRLARTAVLTHVVARL
jgi:hypothetical protein